MCKRSMSALTLASVMTIVTGPILMVSPGVTRACKPDIGNVPLR